MTTIHEQRHDPTPDDPARARHEDPHAPSIWARRARLGAFTAVATARRPLGIAEEAGG